MVTKEPWRPERQSGESAKRGVGLPRRQRTGLRRVQRIATPSIQRYREPQPRRPPGTWRTLAGTSRSVKRASMLGYGFLPDFSAILELSLVCRFPRRPGATPCGAAPGSILSALSAYSAVPSTLLRLVVLRSAAAPEAAHRPGGGAPSRRRRTVPEAAHRPATARRRTAGSSHRSSGPRSRRSRAARNRYSRSWCRAWCRCPRAGRS